MAAKANRDSGGDQTLARVVAHPLRVEALSVLVERAASPKELAAELGVPVGNISYHVRELKRIGLIELVGEKRRRGAIEHFYRAVEKPTPGPGEWEKLGPKERGAISAWIIQLLLADAAKALSSSTLDCRTDRHLSRTQMEVDEAGWRELVEIQENAMRAVLAVKKATAERLAAGGGEADINTVTGLTCFELPPRRTPPGS